MGKTPIIAGHVARIVDLRHEDRIETLDLAGGGQIRFAPRCFEAIDAQDQLTTTKAASTNGGERLVPRRVLRLGRHRIFQIKDDCVAGQGARLIDGLLVGGGHVEDAAPRTKRDG